MRHSTPLDPDACYRALSARDRRFDGVFFVGVTTTGVYCRPVCRARLPAADRCRYYRSAAGAEVAGYRPCLRCHPERAPGSARIDAPDRMGRLAGERILAGAMNGRSVAELASALNVGSRQLHRAVRHVYGASPVQLAQTHRLLSAKRLLTETGIPMTRVAFASGFTSVRRFNSAFKERYRISPTALRTGRSPSDANGLSFALDYRPPLHWPQILDFLAARSVPGVEVVQATRYLRTVAMQESRGWVAVQPGSGHTIAATISDSLEPAVVPLLASLRRCLDLDAEPSIIQDHLGGDPVIGGAVARRPGVRVPGAVDGFELAVRGILGQQVSLRAATTLATRLTRALGEPARTDHPALTHYPISPERTATQKVADVTGLGIPRRKAECIIAVARAVAAERIHLGPGADPEETISRLEEIPGIGPWTAQYIAMRALHWPDAFPHHDLILRRSAGARSPHALRRQAESWRPWRSYAAIHLWLAHQHPLEIPAHPV